MWMLACPHNRGAGSVAGASIRGLILPRRQPCLAHPAKKLQQRAHSFNDNRIDARLLAIEVLLATVTLGALLVPIRPRGWAAKKLVEVRMQANSSACQAAPSSTFISGKQVVYQTQYIELQSLWVRRSDSQAFVQVKPSAVAGQGVFAREHIKRGTILGAYPGFPRSNAEMLQKVQRCPRAAAYVFATDTGYLDPTDQDGLPFQRLLWIDASMAFVNEPPVGLSVNMVIVDGKSHYDLLFVSSKDIPAGAELYLDYGRLYDRSSYDPRLDR